MLRRTRILLATVAFVMVTLLFLDLTGTMRHSFGWMAKIQFLPALLAMNLVIVVALLLLTLVFGRIYCSVVCPLGVMQDLMARFNRKKNKYSYSKAKKWLRYGLMGVFIIALIAGVGSFVALLAPYSSFGRIANNLFRPLYEFGNNALASYSASHDSYTFSSTDIWVRSLPTFIIAAATFVVLFVLAYRNGRTYCNTICPVGTFLSLFARFSWLRVKIDADKCIKCGKCARGCKASCIDFKNYSIDYSRCVVCGNCIDKCDKKHAISYGPVKLTTKAEAQEKEEQVDTSRRSFLMATAMATTAAVLAQEKKKVDGGLAKIEDKAVVERNTPITPPGSISASNMAQHCTACQLCVSACPNDVLRPSSGLLTLMQPTMSYERGYCRPECNECSSVCPAGAIRPITLDVKSSTQIGHAVWVKKNCIPVVDGVECGNCERHCPVGAITMVMLDENDELSPLVPAVNESRCIGCGACENLCPARPFSAIYVEGHEVHKQV